MGNLHSSAKKLQSNLYQYKGNNSKKQINNYTNNNKTKTKKQIK